MKLVFKLLFNVMFFPKLQPSLKNPAFSLVNRFLPN